MIATAYKPGESSRDARRRMFMDPDEWKRVRSAPWLFCKIGEDYIACRKCFAGCHLICIDQFAPTKKGQRKFAAEWRRRTIARHSVDGHERSEHGDEC